MRGSEVGIIVGVLLGALLAAGVYVILTAVGIPSVFAAIVAVIVFLVAVRPLSGVL